MKKPLLGKSVCVLLAIFFCLSLLAARFIDEMADNNRVTLAHIERMTDEYVSTQQTELNDGSLRINDIVKAIDSYINVSSTEKEKRVCLLNTCSRNSEIESSTRNVYSAEYLLEVAGLSYFTSESLQEAMDSSSMIVVSSEVSRNAFTVEEIDTLQQWVSGGGVLVVPSVSIVNSGNDVSIAARNLFGVANGKQSKTHYLLKWLEAHYNDKELEYIDEEEERTTALAYGKKLTGNGIPTYGYTLQEGSGAEALALYNNGDTAIVRHRLGSGTVYVFGYLWRDVIQRSQLNRDMEAQRGYANVFEPSADVTALFLRSVHAQNRRASVWKFTIPDGYESLIIPTHDCDSRTAYDSMFYMSEYEKELRLKAHYFLTVHYYRDSPYMSAFYNEETIEKARDLIVDGHTVGSHSLCHFPDFNVSSRFPMTVVGREEYAETAHHEVDGITTGGSTWAEVVMSKQILEEDLKNTVRSFRTGHLLMNEHIPLAEQQAGYGFASCYSAGDVLSEFPFRERIGRNWTGDFNGVLEMPLHISDVISSDPMNEKNWVEKPAMWHVVQQKLQGNYAPAILLIHPNRKWKMEAERMLVEITDRTKVGLYNFEDYGDFWNKRRELDFDYGFNHTEGILEIFLQNSDADTLPHICFAVDLNGEDTEVRHVRLFNSTGKRIANGTTKQLTNSRLLISF